MNTMRDERYAGWSRALRGGVSGFALCAVFGASAAADAAVDRLVVVMAQPSAESNLFWATVGDPGPDPALQRLVGTDPVTGEYDNSGLAREWHANDDFTEWTFHLHEDAEFHYGFGPVTAHDVLHSYELHTGEDSVVTGLAQLRAAEVEVLDDHTVVFRFDQPRLDYTFAHGGRGSMYVYSKAQYETEGLEGLNRRPAGSGPYRQVERRTGEGVVYERVEDHWQGITPDFAQLELRFAAEDGTKLALMLAGEAHVAMLPAELQADAEAEGLRILTSQNPAVQTAIILNGLYMQTGDPDFNPDLPWADIRVREAMNRALDRDEMMDVLYHGRAERLVRYGMHEGHEGFAADLVARFDADYGYDPERAKELLAEAGYPENFSNPVIPIVCSPRATNPEFSVIPELLQVYFDAIGLETEIRELDHAAVGAIGRGREAQFINCIRNAPIRPSEAHLTNSYTPGGSPYHGYEDDQIQVLIDELTATIDPDERERLTAEAFTYLYEQYSDLPLAAVHAEITIDPEVVANWTFPGVTSLGLSHWHLIERAN